MTTEAAAKLYEAQHMSRWGDKKYVVYNPNGEQIDDLPFIYGFNNGGSPGWYSGCLICADGTWIGGHLCSSESYMPHDLGIVEGARLDRHEAFRKHYPDGYRMTFVSYNDVKLCDGLMKAIDIAKRFKDQPND